MSQSKNSRATTTVCISAGYSVKSAVVTKLPCRNGPRVCNLEKACQTLTSTRDDSAVSETVFYSRFAQSLQETFQLLPLLLGLLLLLFSVIAALLGLEM